MTKYNNIITALNGSLICNDYITCYNNNKLLLDFINYIEDGEDFDYFENFCGEF